MCVEEEGHQGRAAVAALGCVGGDEACGGRESVLPVERRGGEVYCDIAVTGVGGVLTFGDRGPLPLDAEEERTPPVSQSTTVYHTTLGT